MIKEKYWKPLFLGLTALVIGLEIFAVSDINPETAPWTAYITHYIPYEITFLVIAGLSGWLIIHFLRWYGFIKQK